jgi:hypothetical protein
MCQEEADMDEKPKFLGPTQIATSNPSGQAKLRLRQTDGGGGGDLLAALRDRIRRALARTRARS